MVQILRKDPISLPLFIPATSVISTLEAIVDHEKAQDKCRLAMSCMRIFEPKSRLEIIVE